MRQVISLKADGSMHHTLKDTLLNTGSFGVRKIQRMTEILFHESKQLFYIAWKDFNSTVGLVWKNKDFTDTLWFATYDEAVEFEIATVNKLRLAGWNYGDNPLNYIK